VTVPDTYMYAESHIANTAITPGAAAQISAQKKTDKYAELSNTMSPIPLPWKQLVCGMRWR